MASKDARSTRSSLNSLPRFNDDMDPMREVEWRHNFIVATCGVTNEEHVQLWADWLVFQGVAWDWYKALQNKGPTELADWKSWAKLETHIKNCWPTPVHDPFVLAEQKCLRWDNSVLKIKDMLPALLDKSNPIKPHEIWAKQHLLRGRDQGSSNGDLVHDTLKRAIPSWMVALLPKRSRYGSNFEGLCKDIGDLTSTKIIAAYDVHRAVVSIQNLLLSSPAKPSIRTTATLYPSSLRCSSTQVPPAQSTISVQNPIPAPVFAPARAPHVTFATSTPETPARNQPARHNPPHMPGPATEQPATVPAPAPQTPNQHPMRDLVPDVIPNTAEERAKHKVLLAEFNNKYGELATPTMSKPYPLLPGTFKQTRDICIRCGRGFHTAIQCDNPNPLPKSERGMRAAILGTLWRPSRAGTIPGTPTPGARLVHDTAQLEEEDEVTQHVEYYKSENEDTPAERGTPGAGHLSVYEPSENIYVSLDVGLELAIDDVDSYISPPEVVDLYEIFDKTKYKENPFRVWARMARGEETQPTLDAQVTVDGGAMLCVLDKTFWGRVEGAMGQLAESPIICRMADGSCTRSIGRGTAQVSVAGQWHSIQFKVLDSKGNYDLLLGKPWLRVAGATQAFASDTLIISGPDGPIKLCNGHPLPTMPTEPEVVEPTPPLLTELSASPRELQQPPAADKPTARSRS
ncbi:Retrovirus-related Pol polyprotein from transposon opus [Ceratobasidium sp. AG-Ba]|nr:Retrovirus-related Pol polyprotein from transposon opus [Ceratobasidium sp. AG-Ba]